MRLGGDRIVPVDVRVISSSQRDLFAGSREGKFRSDLYFRLATLRLRVPPLRERMDDLGPLLSALFAKRGLEMTGVSQRIRDALTTYDWPGNVRELDALVRTYLALTEGSDFSPELFLRVFNELRQMRPVEAAPTVPVAEASTMQVGETLKERLQRYEAQVIQRALEECHFNRTETARRLGISVNSLWRKSQRLMN